MASKKKDLSQRFMLFLVIFFNLTGVLCFSDLSFVTEPRDVTAVRGARVVLDCQAVGEPPVDIRWLRNRVRVLDGERVQVLSNGSLLISSVSGGREVREEASDEAVYHCMAKNKYGAILSQRAQLTIARIPSFVVQPQPLVVRQGEVARFTCDVTSNPLASITWQLNQRVLPVQSERITVLPNGVLQISDVKDKDAGKYRCLATNLAGQVASEEASLSVESAPGLTASARPEIVVAPQNHSVAQRGTAVLECVARGNPRPLVSWSRADGKPIDVSNTRVLGGGNLLIANVQPHHGALYLCRATTPRTRNYTSVVANLTVLAPPTLLERPESQTHPRAGTARFSCQTQAVPPPHITWLKNGQQLHSNGRIKVYTSKLVITQIMPEDDGMYQCVAENSQGAVQWGARLSVVMSEERPSAPRNVRAETISSSAILLAWERPSYNAHKVIAYSVHYTKAEGLNNEEYQAVIGNDTTSYIVDGLEAACNYSFYVVAYMPLGASRSSSPLTQVTLEDVPLRTPELSLSSLSPTDILVSWQRLPVRLSRGRIRGYKLSVRTATEANMTTLELPGEAEHHLLQGLQSDTIYLLRITASTRVGWSQPSAWTSHRTPKTSSSTVPLAPVLQLQPINCTSISVRWHPSPGGAAALGYRLYYHEEGQAEGSSHQLPADDLEYTVTGLGPREKYHVKLLAFGQNGDGYHADQTVSTPGCPSAPTRRVATLPSPDHLTSQSHNASAVLLRWRRPAFAVGRLLNYTIRYNPVGPQNASTIHYTHTTNQSVLVPGLSPNTRYEFSVRLNLDLLSSGWSASVYHRTPPEAPQLPPASVRALLIEERTALVSWREPEQPGVVVAHYTILYATHTSWLAGEWQILQREGSTTMALLENLEPGGFYVIKMSASNQAGDGPFSPALQLSMQAGRTKNPRHTHGISQTIAVSGGVFSVDQGSVTGVVSGVCIALACILVCVLILISKSRTRKVVISKPAAGGHSDSSVVSLGDGAPESLEVLVPMIDHHFIDSKGGTNLVINAAGPIMAASQSRSKTWSLFKTEEKHQPSRERSMLRGCVYEAGKTLLRYEEELTVASQQPACLRPHSSTRQADAETSDGSGGTGDSGNYSHDEESSGSDDSSPTSEEGAGEPDGPVSGGTSLSLSDEMFTPEPAADHMCAVALSDQKCPVTLPPHESGEEKGGVPLSGEMCVVSVSDGRAAVSLGHTECATSSSLPVHLHSGAFSSPAQHC
ncbi:protogenin B-like [Engraulis encrasicolus]|uniref:protogenin B-like n=1 Tax=Engraulis encrasicolus TaxID=184585 RepID=UPI002FD15026